MAVVSRAGLRNKTRLEKFFQDYIRTPPQLQLEISLNHEANYFEQKDNLDNPSWNGGRGFLEG